MLTKELLAKMHGLKMRFLFLFVRFWLKRLLMLKKKEKYSNKNYICLRNKENLWFKS